MGSMGFMGSMNRGLASLREWIEQGMDRASGMDRVNGWIGPADLIGRLYACAYKGCLGCTLDGRSARLLSAYLIFVIFLHWQNFWRIKFTPKNANFSR